MIIQTVKKMGVCVQYEVISVQGHAIWPGQCVGYFQQLKSMVLSEMECFALAYFNNILAFSEIPEEHSTTCHVIGRLRRHGLWLKLPKCQFLREDRKYFGFVINGDSIKPVLSRNVKSNDTRTVKGFHKSHRQL